MHFITLAANTAQVYGVDTDTLRRYFGQKLRQLRKHSNMTQEDLAEFLDLSVEHVSLLERGISGASFDTLAKLAEAFGVSVKDLFDF